MEVMQFTENDKKVVTISFPIQEDYRIKIFKDKVIFERVRNFAEISEDIRKHLTRDYTDQDVDLPGVWTPPHFV